MPEEGRSGLVIPVPAVDGLLASVAARFPGVVREGVPSHVSLQYPFIAAGELDDQVTGTLAELFAGQPPMPATFAECRRRGGFVYLRPDPIDALAELTNRVRRHWPAPASLDGSDDEVGPHLTIAMGASETVAETIERETVAAVPISAELTEAWLVAFDGRWVLRERFEFGAGR